MEQFLPMNISASASWLKVKMKAWLQAKEEGREICQHAGWGEMPLRCVPGRNAAGVNRRSQHAVLSSIFPA